MRVGKAGAGADVANEERDRKVNGEKRNSDSLRLIRLVSSYIMKLTM